MSKKKKKAPLWIEHLMETIAENWEYKGISNHFNCKALYNEKTKIWEISIAPVLQEIYGGNKDGQQTWTPFIFDAGQFASNSGITIDGYAVASLGFGNDNLLLPHMLIQGRFRNKKSNHKFLIRIFLEPATETKTVEILDTYQKTIREVKRNDT